MTADSLDSDLLDHIYKAFDRTDPGPRRASHWVMNQEWFDEVRRLAESRGRLVDETLPAASMYLLGMPVKVRDDGGVPHLEFTLTAATPDSHNVPAVARPHAG
jgi:HK97 family phage major capsid protein